MESITESYRGMQVGHCNAVCLFASWLFFFGMACLGWRGPGSRYPSLADPETPAFDVSLSVELLLEWQTYFSMVNMFPGDLVDELRSYGVYSYDYATDVATQTEEDVLLLVESFHDTKELTHELARLFVDTGYTYLVSFVGAPDCTLVNAVLRDSNQAVCSLKEYLIPLLYAKYPDDTLARLFSQCRDAADLHAFVPYDVPPDRRYLGADQEDQVTFFLEDENDFTGAHGDDFLFYDPDDDNYLTQENYNDAEIEF